MLKVDKDALRRALRAVKAETGRRPPPESEPDEWYDAAMSAVYHCQMESLRLRPWQTPPCWVGDERPLVEDHRGEVAAWELRRRLLKAGLSQWGARSRPGIRGRRGTPARRGVAKRAA
jgi:hypothetical protein